MNVRVAYYSATGNTRKIAAAIAGAVGCKAEAVDACTADREPVDLLFLGAAVYATHDHGVHPSVKDFVASLKPSMIKRIALFSTGFVHSEAIAMLRGTLESRGFTVDHDAFFCLGRFAFFNMGHPNAKDIEAAAAFAMRLKP